MTTFLTRSTLSRNDLRLFLTNENGYMQDAVSVRWTLYDKSGVKVSGRSLPAIKRSVGTYYAPLFADVPNGNYSVKWEIQPDFNSPVYERVEQVFIVDPSSYCPGGPINSQAIPISGRFTYLSGSTLGPGDLPLYLKDQNGYLRDAYAVFWTIFRPIQAFDCNYDPYSKLRYGLPCHSGPKPLVGPDCQEIPITPKTSAIHLGLGEYYASYFVCLPSGDYKIRWEYQETVDLPFQSFSYGFSVINPASPISIVEPLCKFPKQVPCSLGSFVPYLTNNCACSPSGILPVPMPTPSTNCCGFEISRIVHISPITLPAAGAFTNQTSFGIPTLTRNITFYITYARGFAGGFPTFKLLWGNGTEESQEALVDLEFNLSSPSASQPMYLQQLDGPAPSDNNPISYTLETSIPGGVKTVRLVASEKGVPGTPGTIGITLTASS